MTVEYLRYSRIEKALSVIASGGGAWPADASLMAEALLGSWEQRVGPLKNIRADLYGKGGRLEGCKPMKGVGGEVSLFWKMSEEPLTCRDVVEEGKWLVGGVFG